MAFESDSQFWHCRVFVNGLHYTVYDKTFAELERQIITPYKSNQKIHIDSKVIKNAEEISNIRILKTEKIHNKSRQL